MIESAVPTAGRRWLPIAGLVALALASMGLVIGNRLVQDDIPIIVTNPAVAETSWKVFVEPYWPNGYSRDLYRPFATLTLALQWKLGSEAEWLVHGTSLLFYVLLTLATWGLARRVVSPAAAWLAAAGFAVHPVHVEAVAVGVNQSELMVALFAVLIVSSYIDGRRAPGFGVRRAIGLVVALAVACFYKESAIVIPGLLVAAEVTVLYGSARPVNWRLLRPIYLGCILVVVAFMALRSRILGTLAGTFTAEALGGLNAVERTITMLGVVPTWLRLLVWPAHLQADYSPQEIVGAVVLGPAQWLGVAILLAAVGVTVAAWRREPVIAFGVLWFGITIFPVSNIVVPTGIVLAERTLLMPSAGFCFAAAGLLDLALGHWDGVRPTIRRLALAAVALLLGLGAVRSGERSIVWNNQDYLWERTVQDAPLSYRAHHARAQYFFINGDFTRGEQHALRTLQLHPTAFQMRAELGDRYRQLGSCEPAAASYGAALRLAPGRSDVRASLIACLLWLGRYTDARAQARLGRAWEADDDVFASFLALADSAAHAGAPPRSVKATLPPRFGIGIGVRIGKPPDRSTGKA